ncbi:alpha/beta hydrolase [Streptomyces mashuensis]|uniref:Alpha/beta hydrolase n=1 Tax=Streptomyces mashuensis TaxID=33904 RepID=A0A919ECB2_9ACTN|nr:alpha/beta fold hydrolase [Streptomyces mashuensis]GHF48233.1 alpha/beta hydrolase [Streptomyces mashuensis]
MANLPEGYPPLHTTVHGSGPGVLLAHGASGNVRDNFAPLIPALAERHTVVAPDFPGSGATPRATAPLTVDGLADALVAAADEVGLETFTLLGYSMGTLVAVRAAARYPERVRGLVLTAGLAKADNRVLASMDLWRSLLAAGDLQSFARVVALTGFGETFFNSVPEQDLQALYDGIAAGVPAGTPEQAAVVAESDTTGDLPGLAVPTLVVATVHDLLVSPALSRELAAGIPGAEYAELGSGHVPAAERPEEWRKLVLDFIGRHGL